MMKSYKKGFTLIELLVVIAIIGLLASIVLAAVSSARGKGVDAAVKSQLNSARSAGELYASNHSNSYSGVCTDTSANGGFGGATGPGIVLGAASSSGAQSINTTYATHVTTNNAVTCHDSATGWALEAPLNGSGTNGNMWCVDSVGTAKSKTTTAADASMIAASAVVCN